MLRTRQISALHLLWRTLASPWQPHRIPILGSIIAGRPELQDARTDGCLDVDAETLRLPKNARTFALKVRGDSMTGAGIVEGGWVIMEFHDPKNGDIVALSLIPPGQSEALLPRTRLSVLS